MSKTSAFNTDADTTQAAPWSGVDGAERGGSGDPGGQTPASFSWDQDTVRVHGFTISKGGRLPANAIADNVTMEYSEGQQYTGYSGRCIAPQVRPRYVPARAVPAARRQDHYDMPGYCLLCRLGITAKQGGYFGRGGSYEVAKQFSIWHRQGRLHGFRAMASVADSSAAVAFTTGGYTNELQ